MIGELVRHVKRNGEVYGIVAVIVSVASVMILAFYNMGYYR